MPLYERAPETPLVLCDLDMSYLHSDTKQILQYFKYNHLPFGPLRETSHKCAETAVYMATNLPEGKELIDGLKRLLEAKDWFVRSALPLMAGRQDKRTSGVRGATTGR